MRVVVRVVVGLGGGEKSLNMSEAGPLGVSVEFGLLCQVPVDDVREDVLVLDSVVEGGDGQKLGLLGQGLGVVGGYGHGTLCRRKVALVGHSGKSISLGGLKVPPTTSLSNRKSSEVTAGARLSVMMTEYFLWT